MICGGCRLEIGNAASCACGWKSGAAANGQPTIQELQHEMVDIMCQLTGRGDITKATWFLNLIEPHNRMENPRQVAVNGSKEGSTRWIWAYGDRVKDCLRRYLVMDQAAQETISAARADKIFWRGDSIDNFMSIIDETEKMREMGVDVYKVKCMGRLSATQNRIETSR